MSCKYTCLECGIKFEAKKPKPRGCYKCGSLYIEWTNVKEVINELVAHGLLPPYRKIA